MRQTELTITDIEKELLCVGPFNLRPCLVINELGEIAKTEGKEASRAETVLAQVLNDDSWPVEVKYPAYIWARKIISEKFRNWKKEMLEVTASVSEFLQSKFLVQLRENELYLALHNFEAREHNQELLRMIHRHENTSASASRLN